MTSTPIDPGRPLETAEAPAVAHARALAELVEADAAGKRELTASVFDFDPTEQQEETPDAAA